MAPAFAQGFVAAGCPWRIEYKSLLVENDAYLMQLSFYIHKNPLRAGMVKRLIDYRWSSYRAYAYNRRHVNRLHCVDFGYLHFY
jgi:hypothetical protein